MLLYNVLIYIFTILLLIYYDLLIALYLIICRRPPCTHKVEHTRRALRSEHAAAHLYVLISKELTSTLSLHSVISETLRIHSTSSLGLPRVVPPSGPVTILSHVFPPYTTLSVPAYTVHHSPHIWGPDAHLFRPERWAEGTLTEKQRGAFIPFSVGPRACVGRNVAEMELKLIVGTVARAYAFELRQEDLKTREGFLRKPLGLDVRMRVRRRGKRGRTG